MYCHYVDDTVTNINFVRKEIKGENCPFSQSSYSKVPCRYVSVVPTYALDSFAFSAGIPKYDTLQ